MSTQVVQYRKLGKAGLKVSVPIIGAMSYGSSQWGPWVIEEEESIKVLKAAYDKGLNTIDTANVYSNGESERIVSKFIKQYSIPRNEIVILTKCFGVVGKTPGLRTAFQPELKGSPEYVNNYGLSRAAIFNAVDASLERLNTSYIDLLQIHRYDHEVEAEETMKALHDLVQSGKVRYIGASSMRAWEFAHLNDVAAKHGWTKFASMQNEYSLLYREDEREMLPYCAFNGIGVIPWGPVAGGTLTRPLSAEATTRQESMKGSPFEKTITSADETVISRVEELAKKKGWNMAQVALVWAASKVTSPIVGLSSVKRMEESIVTGFELTEEEKKYLEEPYVPRPVRGHA